MAVTKTPSKKNTTDIKTCLGINSSILKCSGRKTLDNFPTSWNPNHGCASDGLKNTERRLPYCKDCLNDLTNYYIKKDGSIQRAIFHVCQLIDVPFIQSCYEATNSSENSKKYFTTYYGNFMKNKTKSEVWVDSSDSELSYEDMYGFKKNTDAIKADKDKFILDWGEQPKIEDYEFLEYRYDVYTGSKNLKPAEETLYRKLCLSELRARTLEARQESTKDENAEILRLMKILKIDNFSEEKDKTDVERMIEHQIWEIENTEPAEVVDKKEYEDFLNINKNWGRHILRAVKNLVSGSRDFPDINDAKTWGEDD